MVIIFFITITNGHKFLMKTEKLPLLVLIVGFQKLIRNAN